MFHDEINLWPLVRQTIWTQLQGPKKNRAFLLKKRRLKNLIQILFLPFIKLVEQKNKNAENLFFSYPIYLQQQSDGFFIDKVLDPLIQELNDTKKFENIIWVLIFLFKS